MRPLKEGKTKMSDATDAVVGDKAREAEQRRFDATTLLERFGALFFLLVLCAVFAILEPAFLTPLNLFNVLRQVSVFGLLAIGMTFVILTAGIDLSIGALLALAGLVAAAVEKGGTGLLTGADVGDALVREPDGHRYLLPDVVLSDDRFLDGGRVTDLPRRVEVVRTDGAALVAALRGDAA